MVTLRNLNFETGDLSQFQYVSPEAPEYWGDYLVLEGAGLFGDDWWAANPGAKKIVAGQGAIEVVNDIVASGNYALRLSLNTMGGRDSKSSIAIRPIPYDVPVFYDFYYRIPPRFHAAAWHLIMEWCVGKSPYCDRNIHLYFAPVEGVPNVLQMFSFGGEFNGGLPFFPHHTFYDATGNFITLPDGQFVHFQIKYVSHLTNGQINIKMNGIEIFDFHGRTQLADTPTKYGIEAGQYGSPANAPHSVWLDDFYIGTEPKPTPTLPIIQTVGPFIFGSVAIGLAEGAK